MIIHDSIFLDDLIMILLRYHLLKINISHGFDIHQDYVRTQIGKQYILSKEDLNMINQEGLNKIKSALESMMKTGEITFDHVLEIESSKPPNSSFLFFLKMGVREKRSQKSKVWKP